jgi:hypothetical protein
MPIIDPVQERLDEPDATGAEQRFLGCVLRDLPKIDRVGGTLRLSDFVHRVHALIFDEMQSARAQGIVTLSPRILAKRMVDVPELVELGGIKYLEDLTPLKGDDVRLLARNIADSAAKRAGDQPCGYSPPTIYDSAQFVLGFRPPDYLWDGVLQRGFLYSLTGPTGAGKTAVALRLMAHGASGRPLCGREVAKGRALMLVGENADDVRARWIALLEQMGLHAADLAVDFVPAIFSLRAVMPQLRILAEKCGGYTLVVVDTSAAYFQGDDENANTQAGDHARDQRALTRLAGNPCVIANCHPTKNAGDDNLLPRGGGAYLAEMDGNLTCAKKDGSIQVHWQGKFRGPEFEPMQFELLTVESDMLRDSRGRHVPTVIAKPLTQSEQDAKAHAADHEAGRLLTVLAANPRASIAELATHAGWMMRTGEPHKTKVARLLADLKNSKLAVQELKKWRLTDTGEKAAKAVKK